MKALVVARFAADVLGVRRAIPAHDVEARRRVRAHKDAAALERSRARREQGSEEESYRAPDHLAHGTRRARASLARERSRAAPGELTRSTW
jgi:hypothetical protein